MSPCWPDSAAGAASALQRQVYNFIQVEAGVLAGKAKHLPVPVEMAPRLPYLFTDPGRNWITLLSREYNGDCTAGVSHGSGAALPTVGPPKPCRGGRLNREPW